MDVLFEYTVLKNQTDTLEYPTHQNIREKSLPWEAILYEKLHPGYNIGAVGSAYVKRKKESDESTFGFRVPPWKPPEPRLVSSERLPKHESVSLSTPRPVNPPLFQTQSQFQAPPTSAPSRIVPPTSSPWLQTDRRSHLSSPSPKEPYVTQRTTYAREIYPRGEKQVDAFQEHRRRQGERKTLGEDHVTKIPPPIHWFQSTFQMSKYSKVSENISIKTAAEQEIPSSPTYQESSLDYSQVRHPVTDKMPVFIPSEEEDEDQGFRMTEDLIGSINEDDTCKYILWDLYFPTDFMTAPWWSPTYARRRKQHQLDLNLQWPHCFVNWLCNVIVPKELSCELFKWMDFLTVANSCNK